MARDLLAVQATSVAPEDLFCSKGDEIDRQRFSISHGMTQAMLCIKSWTEGGMMLKYKSIEIDYERLMEMATAPNNDSTVGIEKKHKWWRLFLSVFNEENEHFMLRFIGFSFEDYKDYIYCGDGKLKGMVNTISRCIGSLLLVFSSRISSS